MNFYLKAFMSVTTAIVQCKICSQQGTKCFLLTIYSRQLLPPVSTAPATLVLSDIAWRRHQHLLLSGNV